MKFEWNEAKRLSNIAKHGFDFIDAVELFEGEHWLAQGKTVKGEERWLASGWIMGVRAVVVFTLRDEVIRIISVRRSRHDE